MHSIDRRRLILAAGAAAALAPFARLDAVGAGAEALLRRAMTRAGGRAVLERVRTLTWEGEAVVHTGGRQTAIGISTMIAPLVAARSASWSLAEGKASTRTIVIASDSGRLERAGASERLPAALVAHEWAQYAIYGLMLLAPLTGGRAGVRLLRDKRGLQVLRIAYPGVPVTRLYFEGDGRLAEATNVVPGASGGAPISQRFIFSEDVMPGPVRWPRRLRLEQGGKPYFELTLSRFAAEG